jgi:hypothetical protein
MWWSAAGKNRIWEASPRLEIQPDRFRRANSAALATTNAKHFICERHIASAKLLVMTPFFSQTMQQVTTTGTTTA